MLGRVLRDFTPDATGHERMELLRELNAGFTDPVEQEAALPLPLRLFDAEANTYAGVDRLLFVGADSTSQVVITSGRPFGDDHEGVPNEGLPYIVIDRRANVCTFYFCDGQGDTKTVGYWLDDGTFSAESV